MRHILAIVVGLMMATPLLAQKTLADGVKELATQISASTTKEQKRRVAVVPFKELDGKTTILGTYLAEELLSHLVNAGLKVVERGMLDKLLGELRLQQTGAIDPATAKQVGKLAGVDAIVTGTITDLQTSIGINCRLIDTTTGDIFAAAQTKITKDDDVKKIMAITVAVPAPPRPGDTSGTQPATKWAYEWEGMKLVVDEITRSGDTIAVTFGVENHSTKEQRNLTLGRFYLIDENGEEWSGTTGTRLIRDHIDVPPGTRRRSRWQFKPEGDASGKAFNLTVEGGRLLIRGLRPE